MGTDGVGIWLASPVGDQREHAQRVLLRAAGQTLGVRVDDLEIRREADGRPFLAARQGPARRRAEAVARTRVSVSHTRGLTAVAITTRGHVGVDVERVRRLPATRLARRWLTEEEAEWVGAHPSDQRDHALLWVWTHKEALGKARGTGLARGGLVQSVPLPPVSTRRAPHREGEHGVVARLVEVPDGSGLSCAAPPAPRGYLLAVAGARGTSGAPVTLHRLDGPAESPVL